MHIKYNPEDYNLWLYYYANQASQSGYGMEGYKGVPYQRGGGLGSFFRSLFRMAVPVLKSMGRQVGKHALTAGANIASDLVKGRPLFESAKQHAKMETSQFLKDAGDTLQDGEGLGYRPKSINTPVVDAFSNVKRKNGSSRRKIQALKLDLTSSQFPLLK